MINNQYIDNLIIYILNYIYWNGEDISVCISPFIYFFPFCTLYILSRHFSLTSAHSLTLIHSHHIGRDYKSTHNRLKILRKARKLWQFKNQQISFLSLCLYDKFFPWTSSFLFPFLSQTNLYVVILLSRG